MSVCLYTDDERESIGIRREARRWLRSGLITEEQSAIVESRTETDLRRTNPFFHLLFFIFTFIILLAVVGLYFLLTEIHRPVPTGLSLLAFSVITYTLAEYLIRHRRFYRHGIEEALAWGSLILLYVGINILSELFVTGLRETIICTLAVITASGYGLYLRLGYLEGAMVGIFALCVIPFQLQMTPEATRLIILFILIMTFQLSILTQKKEIREFRKDQYTALQAFLFMLIYLFINLQLSILFMNHGMGRHGGYDSAFYWLSYGLTFITPALGVYAGLRSRKRLLIIVSLITAVLTLATNKDYLGLKHDTWDPAIMGIVLVLASMFVTRWLNHGLQKMRYGFTAEKIWLDRPIGLQLAEGALAATIPGAVADVQPREISSGASGYDGGESGGGGASGHF